MNMLSSLLPILGTHSVTLIVNGDSECVTVTAMLKPKDDAGKEHTIQIAGPLVEVEAGLAENLRLSFGKVTELTTSLSKLDAEIAETKKEKEALLKAEKDALAAKKKTASPAKAEPKDDDGEGEGKEEVVTRTLAKPKPPTKASPAPTPAANGLVPAMPPAPAAQQTLTDLGL